MSNWFEVEVEDGAESYLFEGELDWKVVEWDAEDPSIPTKTQPVWSEVVVRRWCDEKEDWVQVPNQEAAGLLHKHAPTIIEIETDRAVDAHEQWLENRRR